MSGRRHVAVLLPDLGGGGAERVALASVTDLVAAGHRVDLLLMRRQGELLPLLPAEVRVVDLAAPRILAALRPLVRYLRTERPDALHAVMWPVTVIAVLAHRLVRSRARLMVSDQVTLSKQMTSPRQRAALRWTTRLFYPRAEVRVTCSAVAADDLAALAGIDRGSIDVIHNPISPPARIEATPEVEALWGVGRGERLINAGSLKEQKNHALLLRAFAKLSDRPGARLMILGEGHLRGALEAEAERLGIADRLILPGFALDPWPYYASADLFVLSSDYEGFPLVLAEAMQAGLRIVSTDCVSGPAELLDGGQFGRLVPCGNAEALAAAMDEALTEPPQSERQRHRAEAMAGRAQIARYRELLTGPLV